MTKTHDEAGLGERVGPTLIDVVVTDAHMVATGIRALHLKSADGAALPPASPGAHIDVHLPSGLTRQYSLTAADSAPAQYEIAVAREEAGRGASLELHDRLCIGDRLRISNPRNSFPLHVGSHYVFIAGGIGITPILAMVRQVARDDASWEMHYACRTRQQAAFLQDLAALGGRVSCYFKGDGADTRLDIKQVLTAAPSNAHFYCCGPSRMLAEFEKETATLPAAQVHFEHFSPPESVDHDGFWIDLHRTGKSLFVPSGKSILAMLLEVGIEISTSCGLGLCGTCEVAVLDGVPDHRDDFLGPAERAANKRIMVCCSGALSERLVLDI